jgi:small subunit ribosomal protein S16
MYGGNSMLRIRLRRVGKKKQPAYRFVVADSRAPRDGAFVDILGLYDPLTDPPTINLDEAKTREWLRKGAQPSDTAGKLLKRKGITAAEPVAEPAAEATATA